MTAQEKALAFLAYRENGDHRCAMVIAMLHILYGYDAQDAISNIVALANGETQQAAK